MHKHVKNGLRVIGGAVLGFGLVLATLAPAALASTVSSRPSVVRGPVTRTFHRTAAGGTNETAVTTLSFRQDSGFNGPVWAYDFFKRTDHMVNGGLVSGTFCGLVFTHACYKWTSSISDSGTFQTILGELSPGVDDTTMLAVETGSFTGSQPEVVYDSYKNAFPGDVPVTENDNGNAPAGNSTSTGWPCQFFGGAGFCHPQGASTFSYSYAVPAGSDSLCKAKSWHWLDSTLGDVSGTGDILAPDAAHCAATPST